jgi:general secretion pathway protein D
MRRVALILAMGLVAARPGFPAAAADEPSIAAPVLCSNGVPGGVSCFLSKKDRATARIAFERGLKLERHHQLADAFVQFDKAARLLPQDPQFLGAREFAKSQLVHDHIESGNALLAQKSRIAAAAEFRAALDLDPDNVFAREQFDEATRVPLPRMPAVRPSAFDDAGEIEIEPKADVATFHFQGDVHNFFQVLTAAYGVSVEFDDSVQNRQVSFNIDNVGFFTALRLACEVSKTMWTPLSTHQLLLAADTPGNHRDFDRMSLGTFTMPSHTTQQEATEFINLLRSMFELRFIQPGQSANVLEVRAPHRTLQACGQLLAQLDNPRPQVLLDLRVFQISHQIARNIGLHIPDTFNLYNIPAGALAALGGQNIQNLINQLISSGGVNQAGTSSLSGLLAQLMGQQNSIFSQPLATFGGGLTFMGLSLDQLAAALSVNESWARSLESVSLRTAQGSDATFHAGERYPILNASYAPIFNSPQISQVLGNQSYVAPFPSVSYEDLGLNLKAKPVVHNATVSLDLQVEVRSLTGQSANGVPVISNREYKGSINLTEGESAVVAGEVSRNDTLSMSGIPGFGFIPLLNQAMVTNTKEEDDDELMIVLTPHIVSEIAHSAPAIWLSER